ncbi:polynucleotide 5'-hydroxyl-kinase NOL9 [Thrips palmi]|uniref:Polynucleotide 5'-hydroxyl-kinase NOL9 n=1 Tax=Thrips palmi TaxID=161013 RepID=A0A6P8YKR0_THRPL|nr:polynucleotide 5'-hydroxyl-kinase NOL9 [Thrips palmi]
MAPINTKKETLRLAHAKHAIKRMKERRRDGKKGGQVNPTVKALVSDSNGLPHDSMVTLVAKPSAGRAKKRRAKPVQNVMAKSEFPSDVNGSLNGLVHNGQRPVKKSKKSSISPKTEKSPHVHVTASLFTASPPQGQGLALKNPRPAKKSNKPSILPNNEESPGVFESPTLFNASPAQGSPHDVVGMSIADADIDYSPYIKPSAVRKVYVNRKKSGSVSEVSNSPYLAGPFSTTKPPVLHQDLTDFVAQGEERLPVPNETRKDLKKSSSKTSNLDRDFIFQKTKKPALPSRKEKPKKSLKISSSSVNIKKLSAPMSIRKTSARVKIPSFVVTADDSYSKSELKTTQFYKNSKNRKAKSGFSVTTVSENKVPVINKSSDDNEPVVEVLVSPDESEDVEEQVEFSMINESSDDNEPQVDEMVSPDESEDVEERVPRQQLNDNSSAEFHFIDGQVILHLKHPSVFTFCGQVQVKVLKGAVEVLGYLLTPSSGYQTVFSPHGSGLLALQTIPTIEDHSDNRMDHDVIHTVDTLLKEGKPDDAFLLMEESENILPFFVSQFVDFNLFPRIEDMECEDKLFSLASRKLQCVCDPPQDYNIIKKGELWDDIGRDIVENPGCTVLCGGKGVGKSTFLRYLINRLLSNGSDKVLVIDFDPGQAEFTVPGCVSLVAVKNPVLGPNFTHLQNPLKCIYIGEINVTNAVSRYMDACLNIISYWQSDEELKKMPCVVNTMGFTKGIGNTIMVQLLSALHPSRVVQIMGKFDDFNYPEVMSVEYVKKSCLSSPFTINLDSTVHSQRHRLFSRGTLKFETHVISSATDFGEGIHNVKGFDPRRRREAVILSYLSAMVSAPNFSILDVAPYCCPLDKLYLNICHEAVPPAVALSAFNANLVALCCVNPAEQDVVQLPESGFPSIISKLTTADCLGFGIVRGIDMDTRLMYLLTPVPSDVLASVNCLVLGAINLPSSLYFSPPREPGAVPYVIQKVKKRLSGGFSQCLSFN